MAQMADFTGAADLKVEVAYTFRDWRQSLFGMLPSINFLAQAHPNSSKIANRIQTGGGTDWDLTATNKRNPAQDVQSVMGAHKGNIQEALWRGIVGLGYDVQDPSIHKPMLRMFAKAGLNVVQNFHGLNDPEFTDPIDQAVRELREEENLNIWSAAVLSVEDNLNYDEDKLVEYAKHRINEMDCKEIYLKSASGRVSPDDARSLVNHLMEEFPADIPIKLHAHDTYGEAIPYYIAAAEAAAKHGRTVIVDGVHDAVSGNTSQPSMLDIKMAFEMHPDPKVRAMAPEFTEEQMAAHEADRIGLLETRARFWEAEAGFDAETLDYMYDCRCPGGADAALKKMFGNEAAFRNYEWQDVKRLIFKTQKQIDGVLGSETQITPFARMQNLQAATSLGVILSQVKIANPSAGNAEIIKLAEQRIAQLELGGSEKLKAYLQKIKEDKTEVEASGREDGTKQHLIEQLEQAIEQTDLVNLIKQNMHPATKGYLAGKLGQVPESTNQDLIDFATAELAKNPQVAPPSYDEAKNWLITDGILPPEAANDDFVPTDDQEWKIVMAATLWNGSDRERGRKLVNQHEKGEPEPEAPDFPKHLKGYDIKAIGGPAEIEQVALDALSIARAHYHIDNIDRLKIAETDDSVMSKDEWQKFHEAKIEKSEERIVLTLGKVIADLKESYPDNGEFGQAVSQLGQTIKTHCANKGLTEFHQIPRITPKLLNAIGINSRAQHAQRNRDI
ncbi:MAG: hypothetical protein AB8B83_05485 [Bdellovibrionales bacterium]